MPFSSKAQRRFMFAKHPEIAKRWTHDYETPKNLPASKKMSQRLKERDRRKNS